MTRAYIRNCNLLPLRAEVRASEARWAIIDAINPDECDDDELDAMRFLAAESDRIDAEEHGKRVALVGAMRDEWRDLAQAVTMAAKGRAM